MDDKKIMNESLELQRRKSYMDLGKIYFWTASINKWQLLLRNDEYKNVIIRSLEELCNRKKIDVFVFVIMPNHIHLIWRINENNGKETSQASFLKYTAHEFKKMLEREPHGVLQTMRLMRPINYMNSGKEIP